MNIDVDKWLNKFIIDINDISLLLNNYYDDKWILTGSSAILYLLYHNNIKDILIIPSDIDILLCSLDLINIKKIGNFNKIQDTPQRSATFLRNNINYNNVINKIDISLVQSIEYIKVNNIKVINPNLLIKYYENDIDLPDRNKKNDIYKIDILKKLNKIYDNKIIKMNAKMISKNNIIDDNNNDDDDFSNINKKLLF